MPSLPRREDLSAASYLAGWAVVKRLPRPVTAWAFERIADYVSGGGQGMEQLRRNLARVVGPENVTRELVRASMRSYMRYWMEAFRLPAIHTDPGLQERLLAGLEGRDHLEASLASPVGTILALPHTGNWDMAGVMLVGMNGQFTTVAERLKPERLFEAFVDYRESLGFEVIALTGGQAPPFQRLKEVLDGGGVVALLAERDLTRTGVTVDFFGEETNMAAGPALLAAATGANLHVVHCWYPEDQPEGWGFSVSAPIEVTDVGETTQRLADGFAVNIAAHPADWHMLQAQWNADVKKRRAERRAARERPSGDSARSDAKEK